MFSPPTKVGGLFFWGRCICRYSLGCLTDVVRASRKPLTSMPWQTVVRTPCALGESPFWHPAEGRLYWVDIAGQQLHRLHMASGEQQSWAMPSEPGCIAPALHAGKPAGLVVALRSGLYRAREWGGTLECIAPAPYDTTTSRFNDGKADPLGRFWGGTVYEPRDAAKAALWSLDGRRTAPQWQYQAGDATTGNGLAFSPDARTLYWCDTPRHTVRAWDWDAASNRLSRPRVFARWPDKPAGWQLGLPLNGGYQGRPDGATVDAEGHYWVAMYEGGCVLQLSPMGECLAVHQLPVMCPTMPCFGGDDLRTLFVTSARRGRSEAELEAFPASGGVFGLRVAVPGLPVNFFRDELAPAPG
jgi:sugar lactone lactonase YvrE